MQEFEREMRWVFETLVVHKVIQERQLSQVDRASTAAVDCGIKVLVDLPVHKVI